MTGYVYILKCADGSYYTGSTKNLEQRLWQHQNGQGSNHTRKHLPVTLMFAEYFERIDDAFAREKQIQGWSRKKKEALIHRNFNQLHELARCQNESRSGNFGGFAGFDSAQPPKSTQIRCLSVVEDRRAEDSKNKDDNKGSAS